MIEAPAHIREAFAIPGSLAARGISLRPQTEADYDFLCQVYVSVRWDELRVTDWSDATKLAFLHDQYSRQHRHYTEHYHRSDFLIIEQHGAGIGRLAIDRGHLRDLRVVDIALLPQARGSGIGGTLLQAVLDEARAEGKKASIHVEQENPAKRLYARLGFRDVEQTGPYWRMETPVPQA